MEIKERHPSTYHSIRGRHQTHRKMFELSSQIYACVVSKVTLFGFQSSVPKKNIPCQEEFLTTELYANTRCIITKNNNTKNIPSLLILNFYSSNQTYIRLLSSTASERNWTSFVIATKVLSCILKCTVQKWLQSASQNRELILKCCPRFSWNPQPLLHQISINDASFIFRAIQIVLSSLTRNPGGRIAPL
jgi:hypothetical protein